MAANSSSHDNSGSLTAQSRPPTRSPWTEVVRGGESEKSETVTGAPSSPQSRTTIEPGLFGSVSATVPAASSMVTEEEKSENAGKKPAWNRPSNGGAEGGPVMGAASWPALSDAAKASSTKSSSDSLKSLSDGSSSSSTPVSQGTGTTFVSSVKNANTANASLVPNRQRSFNKRTGASSSGNGNLTQPLPQGSIAEMPLHSPSSRAHNQRNGFVSQSHGGNENQPHRGSSRNQNGFHHQSHGARRNHEVGGTQWNSNRNMNGRDGHIQSRRGFSGIMRQPPPISVPYMPVQPMQPFVSPVGLPDMPSPLYYGPPPGLRGVPFVQPVPPPLFYQVQDSLPFRIVKQIDFYFSNDNLVKDMFLRQNMDDQGFVPINLIAGFKKVSELTDDIQLILNALQSSSLVEVQGDKIRRHNDWMNWLLPRTAWLPAASSPQSRERSDKSIPTTQFQNLSLEQNMTNQSVSAQQGDVQLQASASGSSSRDSDAQPQNLSGKAGTGSPSGLY